MTTEDLLRETLRAKAGEANPDLTFDEIRRDASKQQRRFGPRTALLAAAAVIVAVGAPTAVMLRSHDEAPSPTPQPTATPSTDVLETLPRSAPPGVTYLEGTTIHLASGGTARLPGPGTGVASIAAYHGGWLVGDAIESGVRWYDNTGTLKRDGIGPYLFAASSDGTRLAFSMDSGLRIGIASGMGEGEQEVPITGDPERAWPAGFLSNGTLIYNDGGTVRADQPLDHPLPPAMDQAEAVSGDDLVAGVDAQGRGIAWSARTGDTAWAASDWRVTRFSQDGRWAAAIRLPGDDDTRVVGILDTRTGDVVVQHSVNESELQAINPVIDADGSLLFVGVDAGTQDAAILRLTRAGSLSRASDILRFDQSADPTSIVFATGS